MAAEILSGGLCALLVLLPAAVNPIARLAFEPLKTSLLRGGAVVLAAVWLWSRRRGGGRSLETPPVWAALAVVATSGLTTALSLDPPVSLGGSFDRGMGWLTIAACGLLFVVVADVGSDPVARERIITALVLGAVLPCSYFLIQRAGLDPLSWTALGVPGSSLGSPTFLAGYLVLVAPCAAYRTVVASRAQRVVYAGWLALLLVICATIVLTTIRGPLVALVVAALIFGVVARPRNFRGRADVWLTLLVVGGAALVVLVAMGVGGATGLQRFLTIAQGTDSSVERLTVWRDVVGILAADGWRAAVGFGPETQSIVLERAVEVVRLTPGQQWDRAHNMLLDTWLTSGLVGVAVYAALVVLVLAALRRARTSGESAVLVAGLAASIVGHLVETAFAFETVVSAAVFWVILGLAAGVVIRPSLAVRPHPAWVGGVALGGLVSWPLLVSPAIADAQYGAARRLDYARGAELEEVAARLAPWIEELPRAAGLDWQQVAVRRGDGLAGERALFDLQEAARRGHLHPSPWLRLVRLAVTAGDLDTAESACQRALSAGPYRATVWESCADVAARRNNPDEATLRENRALALRTDIVPR